MTNFAVIKNNVVQNVIVADTLEIAQEATQLECIEAIGLWTNWTRIDGVWTAPEETTEDPV
jgi:hypothetical protein